MSKTKKILILSSVISIVIGGIICVGALVSIGFDFSKLNTVKYKTNTYQATENFHNIEINTSSNDIYFVPSKTGKCEIECTEEEDVSHLIDVENDTLKITYKDNRKWYQYIRINWSMDEAKIIVSIPQKNYESLYIKSSSGNIDLPEDFSFLTADIYSLSGDINYQAATENKLTLKTTSGDLSAGNLKSKNVSLESTSGDINMFSLDIKNNLDVNSTSGDISLSDITGSGVSAKCNSGDVIFENVIASDNIRIETTSGDINLNCSDGKNISIKSTSGDVFGLLLTEKTFVTKTNSGDIELPPFDISSDKCEIITSSGDIKMSIY